MPCTSMVTVLTPFVATVNLEFKVRGRELIGRQSQTSVRFPDLGWKVISAYVSTTDGQGLWSCSA